MKENSDEIQKLKDEIAEKEKTIKKLMDITESLITDTREFMEVVSKVKAETTQSYRRHGHIYP